MNSAMKKDGRNLGFGVGGGQLLHGDFPFLTTKGTKYTKGGSDFFALDWGNTPCFPPPSIFVFFVFLIFCLAGEAWLRMTTRAFELYQRACDGGVNKACTILEL